jgi:hypothetical protein
MAITVKQALSIGGLQQAWLLAGAQRLDNVINVEVKEVFSSDSCSNWTATSPLPRAA